MLADLFRNPELHEKAKRARASAEVRKQRIRAIKKEARVLRKQNHILEEMKRREATPSDTDATQRTEGHDARMDPPSNTFHEWELRALDQRIGRTFPL